MFTAVKFADEMGISYPTIVRWLKRNLVPGAEQVETPMGNVWQIPESALQMERPPVGRKPKSATDGEVSTATDAADDALPAVVTGKKMVGKKK